ncbi:MAG: PD-(D/E)XK nuclease family protein, partial [Bdellovibrionota bacterium]
LWGEADGQLWVVDYKSGDPRYSEKAFRQLELYAYALSKYRPGVPICLAVIYPLIQKVDIRPLKDIAQVGANYGFS